jgi:hypothetical protein
MIRSKVILTDTPVNLGAAQVDADYTEESPLWPDVATTWATTPGTWNTEGGITFKLYVDKELIFTQLLDSRRVFRLPAGYRSDTFEIEVEGAVRLRAIRLAETPTGLREV